MFWSFFLAHSFVDFELNHVVIKILSNFRENSLCITENQIWIGYDSQHSYQEPTATIHRRWGESSEVPKNSALSKVISLLTVNQLIFEIAVIIVGRNYSSLLV